MLLMSAVKEGQTVVRPSGPMTTTTTKSLLAIVALLIGLLLTWLTRFGTENETMSGEAGIKREADASFANINSFYNALFHA